MLYRNLFYLSSIIFEKEFLKDKFHGEIINIEHHEAHLSSAFNVSPFKESCIISVDAFGDFSSTAWGYGSNNNIKIENKIFFPHSLGAFYSSITQFLGFNNYGDEYKIMGLAPYGKPTLVDKLEKILILKEELYKIISKHSGQDYDKVYADSDRDYWMKSDKALEYGMIDEILTRS